jgi:hypothetical protein
MQTDLRQFAKIGHGRSLVWLSLALVIDSLLHAALNAFSGRLARGLGG